MNNGLISFPTTDCCENFLANLTSDVLPRENYVHGSVSLKSVKKLFHIFHRDIYLCPSENNSFLIEMVRLVYVKLKKVSSIK